MGMIDRLLRRLHRVFNKKPQAINAMQIQVAGTCNAELNNSELKIVSPQGNTSFDLSSLTIGDLATALNTSPIANGLTGTFTRNSTAYELDGGIASIDQPRFETGRDGQAVMVEEGTTNICTAPTTIGGAGWQPPYSGTTVLLGQPDGRGTQTASKISDTAISAGFGVAYDFNVADNTTHTFSVDLKYEDHEWVYIKVDCKNFQIKGAYFNLATGTIGARTYEIPATMTPIGDGWFRCSVTVNVGSGSHPTVASIMLVAGNYGSTVYTGTGTGISAAFFQIENKPYPTSWHNGTRESEKLAIPTEGIVNPSTGTISCWIYVDGSGMKRQVATGEAQRIFHISRVNAPTTSALALYHNNLANEWGVATTNDSAFTSTLAVADALATGWHYFSITWDAAELKFYIDDTLAGSVQNPKLPATFAENLYVGSLPDGTASANALFDTMHFSNRVRTIDEIRDCYTNGNIYDTATTAVFLFNNQLDSTFIRAIPTSDLTGYKAMALLEFNLQPVTDVQFLYPTSLLYQEFQVYSWALQEQSDRMTDAIQQLNPKTARSEWLDYWMERHFNVKRYNTEIDEAYSTRAISQVIRPTQNNVAIKLILQDALGVDANILDAYPLLGGESNKGRFLLDLRIPNDLTSDEATTLINRCKDIVRKYKAGGTDFTDQFIEKHEQPAESVTIQETIAITPTITVEESIQPGPIRYGAGWKYGTPGLSYGTNDAIKEQVVVTVRLDSDNSIVSQTLFGG